MGIGSIPFPRRAVAGAPDAREQPLEELPDEQVALRARRDAAAFGTLYDRYLDRVYRYVRYRASPCDVDDLTSEVFFHALRGIGRYEPRAPFFAWIYRIARNVVIDHHRAKHDAVPLEDASDPPDGEADPEAQAIASDRHDRLVRALAHLPEEQQEVILLRFVEGFSPEECGHVIGKRTAAVRDIQLRALRALRRHISPEELAA